MILLPTTYLGPVHWYSNLLASDTVVVDHAEHYIKQTYRNRCRIAMPSGPMDLVVPVAEASSHTPIGQLGVSEHGRWRHHHWSALQTAYGKSPFFEYYADEFAPFYASDAAERWPRLTDYNAALCRLVCELIDLPAPQFSETYVSQDELPDDATDMRDTFSPRSSVPANLPPYYQVFKERQGFLPALSIVDLLFNMGPESLIVLAQMNNNFET